MSPFIHSSIQPLLLFSTPLLHQLTNTNNSNQIHIHSQQLTTLQQQHTQLTIHPTGFDFTPNSSTLAQNPINKQPHSQLLKMTSHLRHQSSFAPFSAQNTQSSYPHATSAARPQKKQRMTITQTYRLAHSARGKLSSEASRGDHDLRLLVGHANLLDSLMVELQDAENEQEAWFNETMNSSAPKSSAEPRRVQWKDEVISVLQAEVASDDDSESDSDEDEADDVIVPLRKIRSPPAPVSPIEYYGDEEEDEEEDDDEDSDDEFDNLDLALVRTRSHSHRTIDNYEQNTPSDMPELVSDCSDESDDESSPPCSPPQQLSIDMTEINRQNGIKGQDFSALQRKPEDALLEDGYFLPPRVEQAPLIAVY